MYLLVVESPDPTSRSPAAELRALGHMVDPVTDPREAINRASIEPFEAIVLDLAQAAGSRLLLLHELRESNREMPILVVSGQDQIHDRVTALIQGADDYLVRPFTRDDLQARLESLAPPGGGPGAPSAQVDRLIGNLLEAGLAGGDEVGLVISEVRLQQLLERVCAALKPRARQKGVRLRLPRQRLPTLLVDARWLEYLLSSLLFSAISECPGGAEVSISVDCEDQHCTLEVGCSSGADFDITLPRSYARCLRLRLDPPTAGHGVRVSNLRRV